jgi:methyl-accepting chemotaxis protein
MSMTGFIQRAAARTTRRLASAFPSGITGRLVCAGVFAVLAVAICSLPQASEWKPLGWALSGAALIALVGVHRATERRLRRLCDGLDSIALGEVSGRVDTILEGQAGREVESVREMNRALMDIVQQVRGSSERIGATTREVAAGSHNLSHRTEEQAATLEEIASSMEELSGTVRHNSENCQLASNLTRESATLAADGADHVRRAGQSMARVDESSRKIAAISKLIEGIALQTNILALNAAVEAARAGEQGRGFSVVAAEVRELSQRCAEAAQDIKKLIEASVASVSASVGIVSEAGALIDRVALTAQQAAQSIGEIASGSREQSSGVDQVSHSIMQLEHSNLQNAALVEQTSAALRLFEEEVGKLEEAVGHFKLDFARERHQAVELVQKAADHMRRVGRERACDDFDDGRGEFVFGEFYIWAMDQKGIRVANGSDPATRGQSIGDLRDVDGKPHVRNILEKALRKGKGWEDYKWPNPVTRRVEQKSVYFELCEGIIVACGVYRSPVGAAHPQAGNASAVSRMAGRAKPRIDRARARA